MLCCVYSNDGSTWYLGSESGKLRCLTKEPNGWLASGHDDISLHDTENGEITDITVSNRFQFLVDCGKDGNIFVFSLETKTGSSPEGKMERSTSQVSFDKTLKVIHNSYSS